MPKKKLKVHLVSHTHWDREWYLPFHTFRQKLHGIIKEVLDQLESASSFKHFVLDGQAVVVEDHLEIYPEDFTRIKNLVKSGKLLMGPWYILPDEFLVSGESTVRNLLIGRKVTSQYGPIQKIGYMPDSFGHIAQMPQLLMKSGIDNFIYTRGNGDELDRTGLEYWWEAPDGSKVLAINQFNGYCNASALGSEKYWEDYSKRAINFSSVKKQISTLVRKMQNHANGHILLFNNGCDHLPPQREFNAVFKFIRKSFPTIKFIHSNFNSYLDDIKKNKVAKESFYGEMLCGKYHHILSGVWSTRIYLKQMNDRAQKVLEKYLEPLASYAHFYLSVSYPKEELNYLWKNLLKNHPHDSICGCSVDEVHTEMIPRFAAVLQTSDQLIRHRLEKIVPPVAKRKKQDGRVILSVFNPLPKKRSEVIERFIILPTGMNPSQLKITDQKGRDIPFRIIDRFYVNDLWGVDFRHPLLGADQIDMFKQYMEHFGKRIKKKNDPDKKFHGIIHAEIFIEDIPALGHKNLLVTPRRQSKVTPLIKRATGENTIENLYYLIRVHENGRFDIFIKASRTWLRGLNRFADAEDVGDEYDYAPSQFSTTFSTDKCIGNIKITASVYKSLAEVTMDWPLPQSITSDRKRRSKQVKNCRLVTRIFLNKQSPIIGIETEFENQIKDHRLRVHFPCGVKTNRIFSDGQYYINDRPIRQPHGQGWVQNPTGTYPQQSFSFIQKEGKGLALFNRGLPEIEAEQIKSGQVILALTLLRCVEWLSRDDLSTRTENAGPVMHTPDAQCQGTHKFHYAVVPLIGSDMCNMLPHLADMYRTPILVKQGVRDNHIKGDISFLQQKTYRAHITAVKLHEKRNTLVIRLYNTTSEHITENLLLAREILKVWITDLLENRISKLGSHTENSITVLLTPFEVVTIEIKFNDNK